METLKDPLYWVITLVNSTIVIAIWEFTCGHMKKIKFYEIMVSDNCSKMLNLIKSGESKKYTYFEKALIRFYVQKLCYPHPELSNMIFFIKEAKEQNKEINYSVAIDCLREALMHYSPKHYVSGFIKSMMNDGSSDVGMFLLKTLEKDVTRLKTFVTLVNTGIDNMPEKHNYERAEKEWRMKRKLKIIEDKKVHAVFDYS